MTCSAIVNHFLEACAESIDVSGVPSVGRRIRKHHEVGEENVVQPEDPFDRG